LKAFGNGWNQRVAAEQWQLAETLIQIWRERVGSIWKALKPKLPKRCKTRHAHYPNPEPETWTVDRSRNAAFLNQKKKEESMGLIDG
jgi:hypothetical protein